MHSTDQASRIDLLLTALGISNQDFLLFLEWALSEQLVTELAQLVGSEAFFAQPDALKQFRTKLEFRTRRVWSTDDLNTLEQAVKSRLRRHFRKPIDAAERLKLLWNRPYVCAYCGKRPPEVALHIDHILPVKLGGESVADNLQLLCAKCNLEKSAKREVRRWLNLE